MFIKLFRPKWQHRKAAIRLAALNGLAASDPILLRIAREDHEPQVRQQAVRRIEDLQNLLDLFYRESDEAVREACAKRLKFLLADQGTAGLSLEQRLAFLERCEEEEFRAHVLQHASDAQLRRAVLVTVSRPSLLAEVVLNDPSADLRLAALERIERHATLERIAREAKGKDKRVARLAKERLEEARIAELRPQRQADICAELEILVAQGGLDLVGFRRLQKEWDALLPASGPEVSDRYAGASAAFTEAQTRVQAEAALAARQRELCERIEQLCQEVEREKADLYGMDSAITMLERAWVSLEEDLPSLNPAMKERFSEALEQTRRRRAERIRQGDESARLQELLDRFERAVGGDTLSADLLQEMAGDWKAAGGESHQPHTTALATRFALLWQRAHQRLAEQELEAGNLQREYGKLLGQMELALDGGQVQQASSLRDKLVDREKRLAALDSRPSVQQQRRRKLANARLRELRDWRRVGTDQAREELLEQLAALQAEPLDPLKQAEAVKAVRGTWRELDRRDGIAGGPLREAFEQAAEAAYVPCREYHDTQARQREESLAARRDFIAGLEQELAAIDWQQPDWAAVEQLLAQRQKHWRNLGGVARSQWQELNARFRESVAAAEQHLSARRESEKPRREELIRKIEALIDEPDLQQALVATREAQAAWRPEVSCHQRVEQALWRRFREACDTVYARQKARSDERKREEREQLRHREALCEQAEALVTAGGQQPEAQRSRMAALQQQWNGSGGRGASSGHRKLEQRFSAAVAALGKREEAARRQQAQAQQRLLGERLALCDEMESLLFVPATPAGIDRLVDAWQGMAGLSDARYSQLLSERFDRALGHLRAGTEPAGLYEEAQENLDRRRELCLRLEILAGIDSPPAFAEARLAQQVQLLAGAMSGQTDEERQRMLRQLLEAYAAAGPVPLGEAAALQRRVQKVLAAA